MIELYHLSTCSEVLWSRLSRGYLRIHCHFRYIQRRLLWIMN